MNSPSQILAQKIVDRLVQENLLLNEDAKQVVAKLAEGGMETEDWRLAIEKAIDKAAQP